MIKPKDDEISGNTIVLKLLFLLSHIRWLFRHETEILDFTLTSMLGFREGESHTPTPKATLNFNWTGTIKASFALYVCTEKQEQIFGKIYEILSCCKCGIPTGQFILFLETIFWMICPFIQVSHLSSGLQIP